MLCGEKKNERFDGTDKRFVGMYRAASQCGVGYVWIDNLCITKDLEKD